MRFIVPAIFSACIRTSSRSVPMSWTAIGVGEPKLMTLVTMSPGSKPKLDSLACCSASSWDSPPCSNRFAIQGMTRSGRTLRSRSRNASRLMPLSSRRATRNWPSSGPPHEENHVVDAEVRGDLADEAHRDLDVLGLRLALDLLEALHRHLPRQVEVRAGRRPEPEHELARIHLREQLGADPHPHHPEDQATHREIARYHPPAQPDQPFHGVGIGLQQPVEQPALLSVLHLMLEQIHAQYW